MFTGGKRRRQKETERRLGGTKKKRGGGGGERGYKGSHSFGFRRGHISVIRLRRIKK